MFLEGGFVGGRWMGIELGALEDLGFPWFLVGVLGGLDGDLANLGALDGD